MKKSNEPAIQCSIWEGIIFNRSYENVGEQRILAQESKKNYDKFMHKDGYLVHWSKYKLDSDFLPDDFRQEFVADIYFKE